MSRNNVRQQLAVGRNVILGLGVVAIIGLTVLFATHRGSPPQNGGSDAGAGRAATGADAGARAPEGPPDAGPAAAATRSPAEARARRAALAAWHRTVLEAMPAAVAVVVTFDIESMLAWTSERSRGATGDWRRHEMTTFSAWGVDDASPMSSVVTDSGRALIVPKAQNALPPTFPAPDYLGVAFEQLEEGVEAVTLGEIIAIGTRAVLEDIVAAAQKRSRRLSELPGGNELLEATTELGEAEMLAGVASWPVRKTLDAIGVPGLRAVAWAADEERGLRAVVRGDKVTRDAIRRAFEAWERGEALPVGPAAVAYATVVYRLVDAVAVREELPPLLAGITRHEEGDRLRLAAGPRSARDRRLTYAARALCDALQPAIRIQRAPLSAEAEENVDRLFGMAVARFGRFGAAPPAGKPAACLPFEAALTPSERTCCGSQGGADKDRDGFCDPDPERWKQLAWRTLEFSIDGPHRYVYAVEYNGKTGPEAVLAVTAFGDLDCDGRMSTFQRIGRGAPDAAPDDCRLRPEPKLIVLQPWE